MCLEPFVLLFQELCQIRVIVAVVQLFALTDFCNSVGSSVVPKYGCPAAAVIDDTAWSSAFFTCSTRCTSFRSEFSITSFTFASSWPIVSPVAASAPSVYRSSAAGTFISSAIAGSPELPSVRLLLEQLLSLLSPLDHCVPLLPQ